MKLTEVMDAIGEPYELVFVDDGSKDDSYRVLCGNLRARPARERGAPATELRPDAALKAGFDFARGEIVISMDGDLQHDPEEIPGSWKKWKKDMTL